MGSGYRFSPARISSLIQLSTWSDVWSEVLSRPFEIVLYQNIQVQHLSTEKLILTRWGNFIRTLGVQHFALEQIHDLQTEKLHPYAFDLTVLRTEPKIENCIRGKRPKQSIWILSIIGSGATCRKDRRLLEQAVRTELTTPLEYVDLSVVLGWIVESTRSELHL